jgi:hypothetical protein
VWIVAPLAVLGAVGAGWLIHLVVDRLVANAADAIKTTLAILTLAGAVLAGVCAELAFGVGQHVLEVVRPNHFRLCSCSGACKRR